MSRLVRINELLLREISDLLHTRFRDRSVSITVTEVSVMPDLRSARVYYSVLGDVMARRSAAAFFEEIKGELRSRVGKKVILKYNPALEFIFDDSLVRGNRTLAILDDLAAHGEFKDMPPTENPDSPAEPEDEPEEAEESSEESEEMSEESEDSEGEE